MRKTDVTETQTTHTSRTYLRVLCTKIVRGDNSYIYKADQNFLAVDVMFRLACN